ncbi:MAG: ADP-forming succinate--CoA ligase subunit beta [bacterium]|nr:ADP-forming succinate--CoA ligase subunit beta [bacterium]MDE0289406.1 ADP-forming succinate--CoA ligase subunit beta [bacterium]MDE0439476.1 ADP-forming succinate--CoA ligase subunit beta [bacterium]
MDLLEHQGKEFFARYGLPVSPGFVALAPSEAREIAERLGYPVVVKAQVHIGGRGKAGGIKLARDEPEVVTATESILGMDIGGHTVGCVLIEEAAQIAAEYYASFTLDRSARRYLGILSARGGVEIEAVAESDPDSIAKVWVDPVEGLSEADARGWVAAARLDEMAADELVEVLLKLYLAFVEGDADLVEINPLILTPDGRVRVLDAKVTLDANSRFRHPEYEEYDATQPRDERESAAHTRGLQYVGLDGAVGVIANGAGLAMSTVDVVAQAGGSAANFLDIGGGADADTMAGALEVINNDPAVRAIFINIFGGIVKGEVVVEGILEALDRVAMRSPIVLRLDGTNAEQGRAMIAPRLSEMLMLADSMPAGAAKAVELAGAGL